MINFVTESEKQSWILRPIAEEYAKYIKGSTVTSFYPDYDKVNIFVNYRLYKPCKYSIGYFTHREDAQFDYVASSCDWCIAMSNKTAELLPKHKTTVIEPGVFGEYHKNLVIGVVGREYPDGRKRYSWIKELKDMGVDVWLTNGKVRKEDMPRFYKSIDYLLVTSTNEGGPVPVLEALAMCKPVITTDVGLAWDYPVIKYSTLEELKDIVTKLQIKGDRWEVGAKQMVEIAQNLTNSEKK